jgi:hypothetical protein
MFNFWTFCFFSLLVTKNLPSFSSYLSMHPCWVPSEVGWRSDSVNHHGDGRRGRLWGITGNWVILRRQFLPRDGCSLVWRPFLGSSVWEVRLVPIFGSVASLSLSLKHSLAIRASVTLLSNLCWLSSVIICSLGGIQKVTISYFLKSSI